MTNYDINVDEQLKQAIALKLTDYDPSSHLRPTEFGEVYVRELDTTKREDVAEIVLASSTLQSATII